MSKTIHVTKVSGVDVYGHEDSHCDAAGCNGTEQYFGALNLDDSIERGQLIEICDVSPVAGVVTSLDLIEHATKEPGGELSRWQIEGAAEAADCLWYPEAQRAAVAHGANATWVDCASAREAVAAVAGIRLHG